MKQQRQHPVIKKQRAEGQYFDLLGVLHYPPNSNRPGGRARLPKTRPVFEDRKGSDGKTRTYLVGHRVVGFKAPSVGSLDKQVNNNPQTNSECLREAKQLGTFVEHSSRIPERQRRRRG